MGWVKLDDGFSRHPKVIPAGPLGMALQVAALCYCNQYLTDGYIPKAVVPSLLPISGIYDENGHEIIWKDIVSTLVELNIWYEVEDGYQIHDYSDFQPLREEVLKEREQKSEAGKRGGKASAKARAKAKAQADAKAKTKQPLKQNPSTCSSKKQAEGQAKSNPVPVPVPDPVPNDIHKQTDNEYILNTSIPKPGPENMSVCPSDFIMEDIGKRYQEKIGIMNSVDEQKLAEWVEMGMSPSLVAEAIDIAAAKGNKRVGFIVGILKNWYNDGHKNISDLVAAEKKRAETNTPKKAEPHKGGGVPNASAYKTIDPEAVKRWKEMHPEEYG